MSHLNSVVEIDGSTAQLAELSETFAIIHGLENPRVLGDPCRLTMQVDLMGKCVSVRLKGEIVRLYRNTAEVMFPAPNENWPRIVRVLNGNAAA